jgi:hypothetical protein
MNQPATVSTTKCTYCGKPAEQIVKREIHDRDRDPYTNRARLRTRTLEFCSDQCGSRYQMGCEG